MEETGISWRIRWRAAVGSWVTGQRSFTLVFPFLTDIQLQRGALYARVHQQEEIGIYPSPRTRVHVAVELWPWSHCLWI